MKITIITATIDPDDNLRETLRSVASQTHQDVEHIVIDSYDNRGSDLKAEFPNVTFINTPRRGVYAALNEGLKRATGEVIGLVHGSDRLASPDVLATIAATFEKDPELGFVFGNLRYFNPITGKLLSVYSAEGYNPEMLRSMFTPPHPTLYVRQKVAHRVGPYTTRYIIAGDQDMWIRLFALPGVRWQYIPMIMVLMTTGGLSSRLSNILWLSNREKLSVMKRHGIQGGVIVLLRKYFYAIRSRLKSYQHL